MKSIDKWKQLDKILNEVSKEYWLRTDLKESEDKLNLKTQRMQLMEEGKRVMLHTKYKPVIRLNTFMVNPPKVWWCLHVERSKIELKNLSYFRHILLHKALNIKISNDIIEMELVYNRWKYILL